LPRGSNLNWTLGRLSGILRLMKQSNSEEEKTSPWWVPPRAMNLAILAGLLVTLGLPPIPHTGILVPLGLGLLFVALKDARQPAKTLWVFALVHQASLLQWLFFLVPAKTIPTRALVPIQASLAILYVTVFYLLLGWVFGRLRSRVGYRRALLVLPVLWVGMESLRAKGEMSFPWCLTGSAIAGEPLMGLLRASGEIGVSALMVFFGGFLAFLWLRVRQGGTFQVPAVVSGCCTILVFAMLLIGSYLNPELPENADVTPGVMRTEPLSVAAIQANVALEDKWQDSKIDSTRVPYGELTLQAANQGADFVVWAETAVPSYLRFEKEHLNWVRRVVREAEIPLYAGFPDAERLPDGKLNKYNSSGLFSASGDLLDRYAKYHLLPIGEAMPFTSLFPALAKIDVGQAEWTPGLPPEPIVLETELGNFPFSGLICFESIIASQARSSVFRGSRCLVVLTNDGWFGDTAGPRQHTKMALLRAVECGVPLIRCANNGISFLCDDRGNILHSLEIGQRGIVQADLVPGSGRTAYVRWGAWPLFWFLVLYSLVVLGFRRFSR
jgi:apolipoprotein N-acyltransferase